MQISKCTSALVLSYFIAKHGFISAFTEQDATKNKSEM